MTPEQELRFQRALEAGLANFSPSLGIGTVSEKRLHSVLKYYYQPDISKHERRIGRMTADAVLDDGTILEIQTGHFSPLRKKLPVFLSCNPVHLVCPIIHRKWVCWMDPETGEIVSRRKSPKRYQPIDASRELACIRDFLADPGLTIHFPFLEADEYRMLDGWGNSGKRGSSRYERIPKALLDEIAYSSPEDYHAILPELPSLFTVKELQKKARISQPCARSAISILQQLQLLEKAGNQGRAFLYRKKTSE